jgi:hypothetical protein
MPRMHAADRRMAVVWADRRGVRQAGSAKQIKRGRPTPHQTKDRTQHRNMQRKSNRQCNYVEHDLRYYGGALFQVHTHANDLQRRMRDDDRGGRSSAETPAVAIPAVLPGAPTAEPAAPAALPAAPAAPTAAPAALPAESAALPEAQCFRQPHTVWGSYWWYEYEGDRAITSPCDYNTHICSNKEVYMLSPASDVLAIVSSLATNVNERMADH